jgi:hypothetical protein
MENENIIEKEKHPEAHLLIEITIQLDTMKIMSIKNIGAIDLKN